MMNPSVTHLDTATLSAYHDGELGGGALTAVEEHLAACARCRRDLRDLERLDGALGALPVVEPSPGLYDRVLARASDARPRARRFSPRRPLWAAAAILAALTALIAGYDFLAMPGTASLAGPMSRSTLPQARSRVETPSGQVPAASAASARYAPRAPSDQLSRAIRAPSAGVSHAADRSMGAVSRQTRKRGALRATGDPLPLTPDARLIARSGEVDLRVPDVQKTYAAVGGIAAHAGGYVSDSNNNASGATGGAYVATLTLRVPAARFEDTMGRLAALAPRGGLLREHSSSQDITDTYHDLQARLQALQATRAQLTAIMRRARGIPDAMTVLDRLTDVNTSIDGVQGQIIAGANSVMFSTITANIAAQPRPRAHVVVPPPPRRHTSGGGWQPGRDLARALSNVGAALQAITTVAIYAAVYLALPALLTGVALLSRRLRLWRRAPRGV